MKIQFPEYLAGDKLVYLSPLGTERLPPFCRVFSITERPALRKCGGLASESRMAVVTTVMGKRLLRIVTAVIDDGRMGCPGRLTLYTLYTSDDLQKSGVPFDEQAPLVRFTPFDFFVDISPVEMSAIKFNIKELDALVRSSDKDGDEAERRMQALQSVIIEPERTPYKFIPVRFVESLVGFNVYQKRLNGGWRCFWAEDAQDIGRHTKYSLCRRL